ncbi:isoaspartyl peptidase/L-asparaginase [Fulvivirga sp. RKSG066]|uniref:isoaspartyl peptidase/L-asparaginase family protein n=1 Tax=Fulvivirga aurantia TaxID=2529383 RepID=UPI0012BC9335|nr:isoaspartyl peptidase/L-asparaginase [Fulvivirga aurantia]MTI20873.1 isoaspartyl peptidase/L-asparaginase [Fulvivirga aurantia]
MRNKYTIAIHGGAGTILRENMSAQQEKQYKAALKKSLISGTKILNEGGSALDAVEQSVVVLEDCDLFNAGKGAVFTSKGKHEMEASIMCGQTLNAGAVGNIRNIKNPVRLCRKILEDDSIVFLAGKDAHDFASSHAIEKEEDDYFYSVMRYNQWKAARNTDDMKLDHSDDKKFGTVGAVALDIDGNLAAATSTGGLTNKQFGRLGDSAVIGSGLYANNKTCAISCTGYGEFFLRGVVAHDISCLMEYKGLSLQEASDIVINQKMTALGGEGGIIGVDAEGNASLTFNSEGMYRGVATPDKIEINIYR